jgi:hypothetical protein
MTGARRSRPDKYQDFTEWFVKFPEAKAAMVASVYGVSKTTAREWLRKVKKGAKQ